jgi:predicted aldo/keto reductase-like oxidoreductase
LKYRKLGKSGEQVSVLGFGCMRLPILGGSQNGADIFNPEKIVDEKAVTERRTSSIPRRSSTRKP